MNLGGKAAVVTGSGRGIGRAIAIELGRRGARVVVNYRGSAAAAAEVVEAIGAGGGEAVAVEGNVAIAADAERIVQTAVARFGRIDILVNNAGITRDNLTLRLSEDDWDQVIDTNLKGAFLCARAALRPMIRQRGGRIINISSVVGIAGNPGQANYVSAKAGLIGLTRALAKEIASRGITVNAVAPGFIDTAMTTGLSPELRQTALDHVPLGRFGTPEDVAHLVAFLASDLAAYITGQTIQVDGGMLMA